MEIHVQCYGFKNKGSSVEEQSSGAKNSNLKLVNYNLIYQVKSLKCMFQLAVPAELNAQ